MYRCADTRPGAAVRRARRAATRTTSRRWRWSAAPRRSLPFSLETESAQALQDRMTAGTLTRRDADQGVPGADRADQRRGPGAAGRARAQHARARRGEGARRASARRAASRGPLHGIPVLLDDVDRRRRPADHGRLDRAAEVDAGGRRRAGRQAQGRGRDHPRQDQRLRAQRPLRRQHAGGLLRRSAARCCCRPTPTRRRPAPRRGSAAATAAGLAALTVGLETSTDTAQIIAPAGVAGVVGAEADGRPGVEPTACCRSPSRRTRAGPIARTVADARRRALDGADRHDGYAARASADRADGQAGRRHQQHDRAVPGRVTALTGLGRDHRRPRRSARRAEPGEHHQPLVQAGPQRLPRRAPPAARARCRASSTTTPRTRSRA